MKKDDTGHIPLASTGEILLVLLTLSFFLVLLAPTLLPS